MNPVALMQHSQTQIEVARFLAKYFLKLPGINERRYQFRRAKRTQSQMPSKIRPRGHCNPDPPLRCLFKLRVSALCHRSPNNIFQRNSSRCLPVWNISRTLITRMGSSLSSTPMQIFILHAIVHGRSQRLRVVGSHELFVCCAKCDFQSDLES